jgi:membrane fusion protein (multidrug efflux system)
MKKSTWKAWVAVIFGLIVVTAALGGVKALQIGTMIDAGKHFTAPPESVTTANVESADWQASRPAIGTIVAVHSVTLASEVPGRVISLSFDSGQTVRKGAALVRLDSSVEAAQLESAVADEKLAKQSLSRAKLLREGGSNTPADLDAAEARAAQTAANVASLRATIAKKTIYAPFDGRLGLRLIDVGQILSASTAIVGLQSVNPIYAEFLLPQQTLSDLRMGMPARVTTDSFPSTTWDGQITTINTEVDVATRNVRVRATVPNTDGKLRAGMFANVAVLSPEAHHLLVIPATSILYAPFGDSVFTIEEQKDQSGKSAQVARQKFVRLGERRGDLVEVESGLKAGETVVSSGAFKLRNGSAVVVRNDMAPKIEIAPKPVER